MFDVKDRLIEIQNEVIKRVPNLKIIRERKLRYGNNFPLIAFLWGCTETEVAERMYKMKIAKIYGNDKEQDSWIDAVNYYWIANHYNEYVKL